MRSATYAITRTDAGPSTDACMQPDSFYNRLLQLCAARARRSIRHHSEAPASPEQRGAYRSTSASTVWRQLAAPDAALAACWTAHQLQVGRADVQDTADVISAVSEPAHLVAHQRTQHSIVVRPTAVRAISTDILTWITRVEAIKTADYGYVWLLIKVRVRFWLRDRLNAGPVCDSQRRSMWF